MTADRRRAREGWRVRATGCARVAGERVVLPRPSPSRWGVKEKGGRREAFGTAHSAENWGSSAGPGMPMEPTGTCPWWVCGPTDLHIMGGRARL